VLTALAGGVGAAKLLAGLVQVVDPADITGIVNTGDDWSSTDCTSARTSTP